MLICPKCGEVTEEEVEIIDWGWTGMRCLKCGDDMVCGYERGAGEKAVERIKERNKVLE